MANSASPLPPERPRLPRSEILQALAWPDPKLRFDHMLFLRMRGPANLSPSDGGIAFAPDAHLQFNTYFNLFNIGKWVTHCDLSSVGLQLAGHGTVELTVILTRPKQGPRTVLTQTVDLSADHAQRFDIDLSANRPDQGLLFFALRCLSAGTLTWAAWDTAQPPRRQPDLVLAVTTFRREAAVADTVARFRRFATRSRLGAHMHMLIIDNGRSAQIENDTHVTVIGNENLGGAGGFARGLLAATDRGASHCLFMDDDAATPMEAMERTWMFLAYARDANTAVAGAMASTRHAWAIWENGAVFDQACYPLHGGTDLRDAHQVFGMEYASTPRQPDNFYGGWWYFAFPVAAVTHLPFPFFVRGDDVSFSLVHDFNIVTLPGVVSFQESFTEKDSPLTWYLDLRSHMAHHLSLPALDIGRQATTRIPLWFAARALIAAHYDTLSAINIALEDVMRGPDFFAENADMVQRRRQINDLRTTEAWTSLSPPHKERRWINPHNRVLRTLMKLTLNGHLLPFFPAIGNHVTLPVAARWHPREIWGAAQITYHNDSTGQMYTVTHSKRRALREGRRTLRLVWRFWWAYDRLKTDWQAAYPRLTSEAFWHDALHIKAAPQAPTDRTRHK